MYLQGDAMKLKDIADMETYLEERCYCPYEIYDLSGFFFQWFKPETECVHFTHADKGELHGEFVIAQADEKSAPQIIYIEITDDKVDSCIRMDATENNLSQIRKFLNGEIESLTIDEYKEGATAKALNEILSMADAVMVG